MNLVPVPIEGHIVPGALSPYLGFKWVTDTPHGGPMKAPAPTSSQATKPRDLGDERHQQLLSAIKGLNVNVEQNVQQATINEALPGDRDWRR